MAQSSVERESPHLRRLEQSNGSTASLDFIGHQVIISDPRYQGYGLREFPRMDQYANKFYILSHPDGVFISPVPLPTALTDYFESVGLECALPQNRIHPARIGHHSIAASLKVEFFAPPKDKYLVPYLLTEDEVELSKKTGQLLLTDLDSVNKVADKTPFQTEIARLSHEVAAEFEYQISIPFQVAKAQAEKTLIEGFLRITENGKKGIVIIKPKSAAGKGVFFLDKTAGVKDLLNTVRKYFNPEEEVLLEEAIEHNFSPSVQGGRVPDGDFQNYYYGKQNITVHFKDGEGVNSYDSNSLPFGPTEGINKRDLEVFGLINLFIGERLITANNIAGVCGFDTVIQVDEEQRIKQIKYTEANLHFPGSIAVFGAIKKLFPMGFSGLAYNQTFSYRQCTGLEDFLTQNSQLLIRKKGQYGIFPILGNYPGRIDIIVVSKDSEHQERLLAGLVI